ncbi:hypothetical protein H3O04_11350 [Burkholderia sp. KCJ3K979]|uniref:hypothetical protein n=1 Tax=Burkholderia sp. KCJ3K979 TaxID=2759149 RepID=UPI001929A623|nr:hypothetical protein [Burkholderia sp. KCJ3K979]MBL3963095.1 hypothetical protein [Burkholderia sp. KCJ3K979]
MDAPTIINIVIIVILAVATAASGFYAARLWYVASKKSVRPLYADLGTIAPVGDEAADAIHWIVGINNYVSESGDANQAAAKWTAISVGIGAVTTVVGVALPLVLHWLMPR